MQPLKAQVKNGRLTMDEPTELPEGEVIYLSEPPSASPSARELFDEWEQSAVVITEDSLPVRERVARKCVERGIHVRQRK